MMVFSYWEQACALLNYGLLHEDLFFETSGEFFGVWERIKPTLEEGRKRFQAGRQALEEVQQEILGGLSGSEREQLLGLLGRVRGGDGL